MADNFDSDNANPERALVQLPGGESVSMQVVQNIYSEITGKKEKIGRAISSDHLVTFQDVEQLHAKVLQLYEQYNIVSSQCSVTLYRLKDQKEVFSSFERFKLYDSSSLSPVENISIEYNFLIVLPQTNTPQSYKISVNLHSRAALHKRAKSEQGLPRKFFRIIAGKTGNIEVEYVDYTVARTFLAAIQEWVDALNQNTTRHWLLRAQNISEHFPFLFRALTTVSVLAALFWQFQTSLQSSVSNGQLYVMALLGFGGTYLLSQIGYKVGQVGERFVDSYQPPSALCLTRGDENVIKELEDSNKAAVRRAVGSVAFLVAINMIAIWLVNLLGISG